MDDVHSEGYQLAPRPWVRDGETLIEWLRAQLDDDERMTLAASGKDQERPGEFAERWQWVHTGGPNAACLGDAFVDQPVDLDRWEAEVYVGGNGPPEAYRVSLRSLEEYPTSAGPLPHFVIGETDELEVTTARHIARHAPARVLREVESKRRILNECLKEVERETADGRRYPASTAWALAVTTLRLLALPYADRPGYRREWRP